MSIWGASLLGRRSAIAGALIGCACVTAIALPSAASADVPAGYDLFETSPQDTRVNFNGVIPADFFGTGSNPFTGTVSFGGEYLNSFMGKDVGTADTVVQRLGNAPLGPAFPDTAMVPIEIVALNLVSVQPITVTYSTTHPSELWDVEIGLQPVQPTGQVQLNQQNAQGGTFDTLNFPINVIVTFTRISDGATQTQNLGVNLQGSNAPWRTGGCVPPALRIAGLNEAFCPGQAPGDLLIPFILEQPPIVEHDVLPVQPRLEHFQCYRTRRKAFQPRAVQLTDQFGQRQARVVRRKELCNPTQKNGETFLNSRSHLQCYSTGGAPVKKSVAVRNQFGSQRLRVGRPQRLCLPSQKHKPGKPFPNITATNRLDHFQCYGVRAQSQIVGRNTTDPNVTLKDQFGKKQRTLGPAFRLCAPVKKTANGRILRAVRHLVCYRLTGPKKKRYVIKNQFEQAKLRTTRRDSLCVPSVKQVIS